MLRRWFGRGSLFIMLLLGVILGSVGAAAGETTGELQINIISCPETIQYGETFRLEYNITDKNGVMVNKKVDSFKVEYKHPETTEYLQPYYMSQYTHITIGVSSYIRGTALLPTDTIRVSLTANCNDGSQILEYRNIQVIGSPEYVEPHIEFISIPETVQRGEPFTIKFKLVGHCYRVGDTSLHWGFDKEINKATAFFCTIKGSGLEPNAEGVYTVQFTALNWLDKAMEWPYVLLHIDCPEYNDPYHTRIPKVYAIYVKEPLSDDIGYIWHMPEKVSLGGRVTCQLTLTSGRPLSEVGNLYLYIEEKEESYPKDWIHITDYTFDGKDTYTFSFPADVEGRYRIFVGSPGENKWSAIQPNAVAVSPSVAVVPPYNEIYSYSYYAQNNPDITAAFGSDRTAMFNHFVNSGMSEGRASHPNFNVHYYMANYPDLQSVFGNDRKLYYLHYQNHGKAEGRVADRLLPSAYGALEAPYSHVYNFDYYVSQNGDVAAAFGGDRAAILNHFVNDGMAEGRASHPAFNVHYYMANYPDLQSVFGNDLKSYYLHYQNHGKAEGRVADRLLPPDYGALEAPYSHVYSFDYYVSQNGDVAAAFGGDRAAILNHFVHDGMAEGRASHPSFNVRYYMANYPDLQSAFGNDQKSYYMHYQNHGKAEGRVANGLIEQEDPMMKPDSREAFYASVYDYEYYLEKNPDVAAVYGGDRQATMSHFIDNGMAEGRRASGEFNVHAYRANYPDLEAAFGGDLKDYYMHYINNGKAEGRSGR